MEILVNLVSSATIGLLILAVFFVLDKVLVNLIGLDKERWETKSHVDLFIGAMAGVFVVLSV